MRWIVLTPVQAAKYRQYKFTPWWGIDPIQTRDGSYRNPSQTDSWESSCVTADPTFTVEFTNLHVQTGSGALDAGVTISGITLDIEGVALGEPPNIGAYETIEDP